jgi:proteasome accessory factor A
MAVHKVCGIETEFGIVHIRPGDSNPVAASSLLINAYVAEHDRRVGWDFEDETPGIDARGFTEFDALAPEVETHLVNAVLTNGARFYVDHAHPELSTPECYDPAECVLYDRAGEEILIAAMQAARSVLSPGEQLVVHKNNSDGKGNSYGCHENYLLDRAVPFSRVVHHITPFFITRQLYCGAGKVGSEVPGLGIDEVPFQLSQRADFFEEEVGLETTLKRPIVNTRDEPHADPKKYRRLHVIIGDANLSEVATYLKVGTTALVLAMIDDDALPGDLSFATPVRTLREVSYDPSLQHVHAMADGRRMRALEVQWQFLEAAGKYGQSHGYDAVGGEAAGKEIFARWEAVLTGLEHDPASLSDQLDWVAKQRLFEGYMERHGVSWADPAIRALDLQYHDLRPDKSLARRLRLQRVTDDDAVQHARKAPPARTRAYFRGRCLERFAPNIVAANWDSLVFDIGTDPLRRVPMMEPLRGTADHVATLLDEAVDAADLLRRLGSR